MGESPDDEVIRSYLLGDMNADERAAFQQRLFADDELFERTCAVEDGLIDALVRNELSAREAARVRSFLEESGQKDRLPVAEAIARLDSRVRPVKRPVWPWAVAAAAAVFLAFGALWFTHAPQTEIAQVHPPPQADAGIFIARVPAGTVRSAAQRATIAIPANTKTVELRLEVRSPGNHPQYRVDITRESGETVTTKTIPGPLSSELAIQIAREALPPANYELALSGLDSNQAATPIDYYYCTIR